MAPPPGAAALEKARAAARSGRGAIRRSRLSPTAELREWQRDGDRTLYVFDVRTPEEYLAGHLPEIASAPGGQLVQSTDAYVGTRNARIVLVDSDGVRAPMTASWLAQMGWRDVFVWRDAMVGAALVEGPAPLQVLGLGDVQAISPARAERSARQREGRRRRSREQSRVPARPHSRRGVCDPLAARAVAAEARSRPRARAHVAGRRARTARGAGSGGAAWNRPVSVLDGGTAAWSAADLALEPGATRMLDDTDDVYYLPYDHADRVEQAMRDYLTWEVALVEQLAREGVRFPEFPRPPG